MHCLLKISYDGQNYSGWQSQPRHVSVQDTIADAVKKVFGQRVRPVASSRTDSGVHALGQLAVLRLPREFPVSKLAKALNTYLPNDIRIISAKKVGDDFNLHAIQKEKEYAYFVLEGDARPFYQGRVAAVNGSLDENDIGSAIKHLIGRHDFKSFQAQKCARKTTICDMKEIKLRRVKAWQGMNGRLWKFTFRGDAFLRHMIRNMVGLLIEVGQGRRGPGDVRKIMSAKDRRKAGRCAPAGGLYLVKIKLGASK